MRGKNILLTGGTGFIGANLARRLIELDCDLHLACRAESKKWRIDEIAKRVTMHTCDLVDSKRVRALVRSVKPAVVFHMAAYGAYPLQKDFRRIIESNVVGTANLLDAISGIDVEAFINAGSSSEYGFKRKAMKETDYLNPTFNYAAAKASASLLCQAFARAYKKPVTTLRFFSVYGPWEEPGRFIPTIICNALRGRSIDLTAGKEVRDFVYVEDAVDACIRAAKNPVSGEMINIGTGIQTRVAMVGKKVAAAFNVETRVGRYKPRSWDTSCWRADTTKAKRILGWSAVHSIDDGLQKSIKWFRENLRFYE